MLNDFGAINFIQKLRQGTRVVVWQPGFLSRGQEIGPRAIALSKTDTAMVVIPGTRHNVFNYSFLMGHLFSHGSILASINAECLEMNEAVD